MPIIAAFRATLLSLLNEHVLCFRIAAEEEIIAVMKKLKQHQANKVRFMRCGWLHIARIAVENAAMPDLVHKNRRPAYCRQLRPRGDPCKEQILRILLVIMHIFI